MEIKQKSAKMAGYEEPAKDCQPDNPIPKGFVQNDWDGLEIHMKMKPNSFSSSSFKNADVIKRTNSTIQNPQNLESQDGTAAWKARAVFNAPSQPVIAQGFELDKTFNAAQPCIQKQAEKFLKKGADESSSKVDTFPYYHTQRMLKKYRFLRIESQVYVYLQERGYYRPLNDDQLETLIRTGWDEMIQIKLSSFNVMDILKRIKHEPDIQVDDTFFDQCNNYVNFLNGTIDVESGIFSKHSKSFGQTSVLNAEYYPNLSLEDSLFQKFIRHITDGEPTKLNHLQEILGYMLSNYTKVKRAVIFDGVRNSSKSTLLRVIEKIIGNENVSHFTLAELNRRFVTGKLMNKKINICGERGSGLIKDIEVFKMITGGDWCESENKGQDFISRPAKAKLVFAGNFLPSFENEDDNAAFMERITLFIFQNSVPNSERIINMDDLLFQERNLIVSWAMEGLRRLVQSNFTFSEAEDAALIRRSRNMQTNPVDDFLNENCIFAKDARVFSANLYGEYRSYCRDNALDYYSQREFISEVIAKTEGRGVIHKKLRIGKSGPYLGFENMGPKNEIKIEAMEQEEQRNNP